MPKLLIADDDENLKILYYDEFTDDGYDVILASDGKEVIEKAEQENPDVIIMDIRMPGMDGIEAMGEILAKNKKLSVILNTAYSIYKDNFLSWPADAYIIKSSDLTELKQTVKKILDRKNK